MKKVTILSLHLGYGGIEKCVVNLANLLCNTYDVEIISTYKLGDVPAFNIDKKVKVKYLYTKYKPNREEWKNSIKKLNIIKFLKESYKSIMVLINRKQKTIEAIKNSQSDIIISTRLLFNKWLGEYGNKKIYKIAWEHNHPHNDIEYSKKLINSCKKINKLVLVSNSINNYYKKLMKDNNIKCKTVFIPNMIEDVPLKISKQNNNRFVAVGRFTKEKGFTDLIDIFKKFTEKYPKCDWNLDLVGDGPEKNKIIDRIYEYQLTDRIKTYGFLNKEEVYKIMNQDNVYLMTSYTESFGIVLIEAMVNALPSISFTSAEGANDLIINDNNGYLIKDRDQDKFIDKMYLLASNKKLRQTLGKNAREFSLNYTSDKIKVKWLKLLKRKD